MTPELKDLLEIGLGAALAGGLGMGASAYASMWPGSRIYGRAFIAPENPLEWALTFDDGPHPRWTPMLLEVLARYDVRASFFLIGKYAAEQPQLVREVHRAGHLIGNHTWTHPNLARCGRERTWEELARTSGELEGILGERVRFFRPPFGGRGPGTFRLARQLGLEPVLWNAMTSDWAATKSESVTVRLVQKIEGNQRRGFGSNIVLHDGSHESMEVDRSASVGAAGALLGRFAGLGRFVRLDAWG